MITVGIVDKSPEVCVDNYACTKVRPLFPWTASAVFISVHTRDDDSFVYVIDRHLVAEFRFVVVRVTHALPNVRVSQRHMRGVASSRRDLHPLWWTLRWALTKRSYST